MCAEPGNSGGPLFTQDGPAVGLTSGGSGDCTAGGETFFQPVTTALEAVGATLGDGAGAGDEVGEGAGDGLGTGAEAGGAGAGDETGTGDGTGAGEGDGTGAGDAGDGALTPTY